MVFIYTIYKNPFDHPGKFVVRRYSVDELGPIADAEPIIIAESLNEAREAIPGNLIFLGRSPKDDAVIVESWI